MPNEQSKVLQFLAGESTLLSEVVGESYQKLYGFSEAELKAAFELVQNSSDWKAPIFAYVTSEELRVVGAAIKFFTATTPQIEYIGRTLPLERPGDVRHTGDVSRFKQGDHILRVQSVGYRLGPAGG